MREYLGVAVAVLLTAYVVYQTCAIWTERRRPVHRDAPDGGPWVEPKPAIRLHVVDGERRI